MVKIRKSDWSLILEAENDGRASSMTGIVLRNRTSLNEKLSGYFRKKVPGFLGSFDEDEGEDVLYQINKYIKDKGIDKFKKPINFPYTTGSDVYLVPFTANLQLKLLVVDEYQGGGDYEKYVDMSYFIINENTNETDVDELVGFLKTLDSI